MSVAGDGIPPASFPDETGQVPTFVSLEARCDACAVYGGPQNPCLSAGALMMFEARTKRPCPRAFLDADNLLAWELLPLLASESVAFAPMFELSTADMEDEERASILRRIHYALGHPEFREAKRAAEQAAARREKRERG